MLLFAMPISITVFMFLDASGTLKDLKLRFGGQKHVFCTSEPEETRHKRVRQKLPEATHLWRVGGEFHSFLGVVDSSW